MKLKSFAYLKKTGTCSDKETIQGKEPKQEEETFFELKKNFKEIFPKKITVKPFDGDDSYFSPVNMAKDFHPNDSLMESGYCYGCINFVIDAPGTLQEIGWCKRIDENGAMGFRRILSTVKVRQCKGKVESTVTFAVSGANGEMLF